MPLLSPPAWFPLAALLLIIAVSAVRVRLHQQAAPAYSAIQDDIV
ncbi:MAG: hypothetical protein FD124_3479 [Alphaproteobacteria bacterium]|nr:MAG: hypothetical protein FD160_1040 [Caulobacteraceae bacterium]TPW02219.1 MAG: hypothetical protein FD124_3479 [Alphaproteobacteria bacterium]